MHRERRPLAHASGRAKARTTRMLLSPPAATLPRSAANGYRARKPAGIGRTPRTRPTRQTFSAAHDRRPPSWAIRSARRRRPCSGAHGVAAGVCQGHDPVVREASDEEEQKGLAAPRHGSLRNERSSCRRRAACVPRRGPGESIRGRRFLPAKESHTRPPAAIALARPASRHMRIGCRHNSPSRDRTPSLYLLAYGSS